jgi:putative membrane protein
MKALVFGLMASLAVGGAYAQTAPTPNAPMGSGTTAASGDSNQAVATTHANAPMPAKGANSFTMSEARNRIANNGFTNVTGLTKDTDGVWRGHADKDGTKAAVWLDYKGNVGTN